MNELSNNVQTGLTLQPKEISISVIDVASRMGDLAFRSGIFKAPKAEAVAMIMLKGYELGFPMTAAAEFIQVIEGTVGLTPRGALAIMHNHPEIISSVDFEDLTQDGKYYGCRCSITRIVNGKPKVYTKSFTLDDAAAAQLIKPNGNWEKYPQQMCQWRALGFAADIACPDLLAGLTGLMKMPELTSDGSFTGPVDTERIQTVEVVEPDQSVWTLSSLLEAFPAEQILAANNGAMPRNNDECARIAEVLQTAKG